MGAVETRRKAPGPRGHFIAGVAPAMRKDIIKVMMDGWREYGDIVRFRAPFPTVPDFLLAHPDHVKHILQDKHTNYVHPPHQMKKFSQVVGQGLVASEGDYWRRQRRMANPSFHRQHTATFGRITLEITAEMLERWEVHAERGKSIDMRLEMMALTLAVLAKAIFGTDWTREADAIGSGVTDMLEHTFEGMVSPLDIPVGVPIPSNRRFLRARNAVDALIYRVIAERRRSGPDGTLMSLYVEAKDEETGETMTDRQVRDEIMALLIAGHETVSTGMVWTWYLLSKHPYAWQRVQAELAEVLGGRTPTPDDVPQLKYITMVLEESMRLYPPLWVMGRMPLTDDEIDGYHIPARSIILLSQYVTHRHPDFWENPEGFDPERFLPERSAGRHRYAYFPFGGGPRKCIGQGFAMVEMPLIVALVAQHYRLDVVPGHPIALQPGISLRAKHGMLMTIHKNPARSSEGNRSSLPPTP